MLTTIDIFTRILLGAFIDKLHTLVVVRVECDSVSLVHKSGTLCRLVNVSHCFLGQSKTTSDSRQDEYFRQHRQRSKPDEGFLQFQSQPSEVIIDINIDEVSSWILQPVLVHCEE